MSGPVSDNKTPGHQMYAPNTVTQQRVDSPPMYPSHARVQGDRRSPSFGEDLEDEVRRQPYEPEPISQTQPRRREYFGLRLINWIVIAVACTTLGVIIGTITKPLWQGLGTQHPLQASRLSDHFAMSNAPADTATEIAASPGARQSGGKIPVQGVTETEIRFGISAPFSGAAKELGHQMKLGIEAAFNVANTSGGVNGRQLRLVAADDGYEPTRAAETMKQLYEQDRVFGIVGNVGTPTAVVALPYALARRMLFYGAFTGAGLLRSDPPDRYVFNYRASYAEETDAVVRYLVKMRRCG